MSERTELVRRLFVSRAAGFISIFRDDAAWAAFRRQLAPHFVPDCRFTWVAFGAPEIEREGLDGLRAGWLEWFAPWRRYTTEVEEVLEADDGVVVLVHDRGVPRGADAEVEMRPAAVARFRGDLIEGIDHYADRNEALTAAGLAA